MPDVPGVEESFGGAPPSGTWEFSGAPAVFRNEFRIANSGIWEFSGAAVTSFVAGVPGGGGDPSIETFLAFPMDEPEDVRCLVIPSDQAVGEAILTGPGLVPVFHGMRRSKEPVSMEVSGRRIYAANGLVRPVEYGEKGAAFAGITPPAGEIDLSVERASLGVRDQGALEVTGDGGLFAINNITGFRFSESDIGRLVYIPSSSLFDAGSPDGPDYIGVIDSVTDFSTIGVIPALTTTQDFTAAKIYVFPAKTDDAVPTSTSWINALAKLPQTTPYSDQRPMADGTPALGTSNDLCLEFKGLQTLACFGVDAELEQGKVIDLKGYFRPTKLDTQGGGRIILWSRYTPDSKAAFELSVIDNGRVEFRFWDTLLNDWRSIATVGRCFAENSWHYLRFRYEFKNAGGWQVDDRNILRRTTGLPIANQHRDGFWCWNLEGKNPADRFLVVAGTHNAFDTTPSPASRNTSREIGNVGYLQESPWIGPRKGDASFDKGGLATERPVMLAVTRSSALVFQMQGAADMVLPRWFSANRDEPYTGDGRTQLSDADANYYTTSTPGTPGTACTTQHGRAVLVYIYGRVTGAVQFATPRVLALLSIGSSDLDNASANGSDTTTFYLSNSAAFGADGLAENVSGGDISVTGTEYIIAFALPNGSNAATGATGNTSALPTLMVQGDNPVGTNDAPMRLGGTVYIGGIDASENLTSPEGRATARDSVRLNFQGQIDDVGFSILTKVTTAVEYTADHMAPDHQFNGPVDVRIGSLPQLDFAAGSSTAYDIGGTSQNAAAPTWASRCDTLRGRSLTSTTGSAPQVSGEVRGFTVDTSSGQKSHGRHKVVVTFYDPARDHESPPSEEGEVTVQVKPDELEPDAERVLLVDRLPICTELGREIWRRVYLTRPDGDTFFLAAEVRDNLSTAVRVQVDTIRFTQEDRADFGYQVPPVCRFLAASESRMYFGGILDAESAIYWSEPFRPWEVPGRAEVLEARDSGYVNGLAVLNGTPFAFSRAGIFAGQEVGDGNLVRWSRVQSNTGAVSHMAIVEMEDNLLFPDGKGVFAFDGTGRVTYLSEIVRPTYRSLDPVALRRSFGAYSRQRGQYLLAGSEGRSPYQTTLLTMQLGGGAPIWSREVHSQGISALLGGSDPRTDERQVYAGTPSGFLMELDAGDRPRGQYVGDLGLYGAITATVLGGGGSYFVTLDLPDFDDALDGIAGVPYLITRTTDGHTSVVDRGFCWRFDGVRAHTMQKVAADVQYGDDFWLGGWAMQWASKAFDMQMGTARKKLQKVDLVFDREVGGLVELTTHADFATTATVKKSCPMDRGFDLPHVTTRGAYTQVKLLKVCQGTARIHNLGLRVMVETQRGGGDGSST